MILVYQNSFVFVSHCPFTAFENSKRRESCCLWWKICHYFTKLIYASNSLEYIFDVIWWHNLLTKAKERRPSWKLVCQGNLKQKILKTSSCKLSPLFESHKYAKSENDCKSYISTWIWSLQYTVIFVKMAQFRTKANYVFLSFSSLWILQAIISFGWDTLLDRARWPLVGAFCISIYPREFSLPQNNKMLCIMLRI